MRKRIASVAVVLGAIAVALLVGLKLTVAQQDPGHSMAIVVHEENHVTSKPLHMIPPIPAQVLSKLSIRLRHPHPLSGVRRLLPDPALQTSIGTSVATTGGPNFLGVGVGLNGYGDCCAPPDTNGAAGPLEYVQWVNLDFAVFAKYNNETINSNTYNAGQVVYGPAAGNTLWSALGGVCASNNSGDPIAEYDKQAGRWVMMQAVFKNPYTVCVAVSKTSDATGAYNLYSFPVPSNYFPDYPKLGVWPDGYYLSYNQFNGNTFAGAAACSMDRTNMLQGNAATMQCFQPGNVAASLLPSDLDGDSGAAGTTAAPPAGSPNYFLQLGGSTSLELWKFHVDWANSSNSTFTGPTAITVPSYSLACGGGTCVPQSGTNEQLDSLGDRMMYRLAYRNVGGAGTLVATHSVDTGSGNTGVRWYEITGLDGSPTAAQASTYSPDSFYRWMGSIAMDKLGDIALGYSVSGSTMHPAVRYTGRLAGDTPNTMESENSIVEGGGSQLTNLSRWGDYSSMAVDPVDDCTFWYTNEYLLSNGTFNWSTRVGSFDFAGCGNASYSVTAASAIQSAAQSSSADYTLSLNPLNGYSGTVNLTAVGLPSGASASFTNGSLSGGSSTLTVSTDSSVSAGTYNFTVEGNDGGTTSLTPLILVVTAAGAADFSVAASPSSQTVTQGSGTSYSVSVTPSGGFTGTVGFNVTGLPSGAGYTLPSVSGGSGSSTMSVTTSSTTPTGTYTLTITGTSGSLTHTATVTLQVNAAGPTGNFALSAGSGSITVAVNSSSTDSITVTPSGGFTGSVSLSLSGLPRRTSASFSVNPVSITGTGSASSVLTVTTNKRSPTGTYPLTVTATSGSLTQTLSLTLVIGSTASPDFALAASPSSQTVSPGSGTSYTVNVTASGGFTGTVGLSASGLPSGAGVSFNPTSVSGGSGTSTMSVTTSSSTPNGTYPLTITGTSGSLIHATTVTLVVGTASGGDFSLSASPGNVTLHGGGTATYSVTLTPSGGFSQQVNFSMTGAPGTASSSFSPPSVTGSGSTTLSVTLPSGTSGNYTLTITGTSTGGTAHSVSVGLKSH